jgi:F0F1-type ATP synthase membrane subunit b/b'
MSDIFVLDESFWLAVSFAFFYIFLGKKIVAAAVSYIDKETTRVSKRVDDVAAALKKTNKELHDAHVAKRDSTKVVNDIIENAYNEADIFKRNSHKSLAQEMERQNHNIVQRIASYERDVIKNVYNEAVDKATKEVYEIISVKNKKEPSFTRSFDASIIDDIRKLSNLE